MGKEILQCLFCKTKCVEDNKSWKCPNCGAEYNGKTGFVWKKQKKK